jgi:hypothetical protein
MKPYHILHDFRGSQTGLDSHEFTAGTTADLSDALAAVAVGEGWAEPAPPDLPVGRAAARHTKVTGPTETKPSPVVADVRADEVEPDAEPATAPAKPKKGKK